MADIQFVISVDSAAGTASVKAFSGEVDKLKGSVSAAHPEVGKLQSSWQTLAGAYVAGLAAFEAVNRALGSLKQFMSDCIGKAIAQESAEKTLELALSTTGRTIYGNLGHYKNFSEAMAKATTFTREEIIASEALFLQLTNLNQNGIDQAVGGAMGLARVFGIDLYTATRAVAQGFEGNYMQLGRYIPAVRLAKTEEEKHAAMVKALADMLDVAKGSTETFGGSLTQLKKAYDELKKSLGEAIIKNDELKAVLYLLRSAIDAVTLGIKGQAGPMNFWSLAMKSTADMLMSQFGPTLGFIAVQGADYAKSCRDAANGAKFLGDLTQAANPILKLFGLNIDNVTGFLKLFTEKVKEGSNTTGVFSTVVTKLEETKLPLLRNLFDVQNDIWEQFTFLEKGATAETRIMNDVFSEFIPIVHGAGEGADEFADILKHVADQAKVSEATVLKFCWDVQAAMLHMVGIIVPEWPQISTAATKTIDTMKHGFDNFFSEVARKFADTIQNWVSGLSTFKDFWKGIWADIKDAFFKVIGEMIAKWVVSFVLKMLGDLKDIAKTVADVGKGVAQLATSAVSAASSVLSMVGTVSSVVTAVASVIDLFRNVKQTDVTYWLKFIDEGISNIWNSVTWWAPDSLEKLTAIFNILRDIKDARLATMDQYLMNIRDYAKKAVDLLAALPTAQSGAYVTRDALVKVHAGETIVPAYNRIQNTYNQSAPRIFLNIGGQTQELNLKPGMQDLLIDLVPKLSADGRLKFYARGIV